MTWSLLRRAGVVLPLAFVVGCSGSTSVQTDAENVLGSADRAEGESPTVTVPRASQPAVSLPDFESPAELEQAILSFAGCVEQSFPIVIRFQTDPFFGLATEVGSQRREDGELVDRVISQCQERLDLDRRLTVYQLENPLSPEEERALVDEYVLCARSVSTAIADLLLKKDLDSYGSVVQFESGLVTEDVAVDDLVAVSDCQRGMTGPKRVFSEGHPWFVP